MSIKRKTIGLNSLEEVAQLLPLYYFIMGKGGSGKSTIALLIVSIMRWLSLPVRVASADPANPTLPRYFPREFSAHPKLDFRGDFDEVGNWLETEVFGDAGDLHPTVVECGANVEGSVLRWLGDRGSSVRHRLTLIVPLDSRDALTAASRIIENAEGIRAVLIKNQYGRLHADAAVNEEMYREYAALPYITVATLPRLGDTMAEIHRRSITPDELLKDPNAFSRHGAETMLHRVREAFSVIGLFDAATR